MSVIEKINGLMKPGESLRQRVARGGMWVFATQGTGEGLRFVRLMILARLLAPGDFGLMGIALLTMSSLESFTRHGFDAALIQKKGDIRKYLDTTWTVNGLRGLVLCGLLFLAAPYVGDFFNEPAATPIVQVVALFVLIRGWVNIGVIYFDKELEFKKKFAYHVGGTVVDLVVAVSAVLILGSVWALVFGLLAGEATRFILSYLLHPYRPRPRLDLAKAGELFGFGKWILASAVLVFLLNQGADIVVGKLLVASALGLYRMAYRISSLPATQITLVIYQVTFPAYSKLQDNLPKLKEAYLSALKLTAFLSFPLAAGIFVLAPEFTRLFLTDKWMPMVPAMQVLAIFGLGRGLLETTSPLFRAVGKPGIDSKLQFARLLVMGSLVYPFTTLWGITGAALAVVGGGLIVSPVAMYLAAKITGSAMRTVLTLLGFPLVSSAIMVLAILALKSYLFGALGLASFVLVVGIGALVYFAMVYIFDRRLKYNMLRLITEKLEDCGIKLSVRAKRDAEGVRERLMN